MEESRGYLSSKIQKLMGFFNLIFTDISDEEKANLEECIIECYKNKEITFEDESLYKIEKGKKVFKDINDMPILEDLYNVLLKSEKTIILAKKLNPFINGYLNFFNNYTNIKLDNKLRISDIYDLGEENIKYGMYMFTELFWDKIKKDRNTEKAIYLDEIWRLIGITSNKDVASFIYRIFKTIRKYGGTGVAITQDVSDLFGLENGIYGKSILNNSSIKAFFSLEEENINILSENTNLSEKEKVEIKSLRKGECMLFIDKEHILAKIESSDYEKNLII